MHIYSNPITLFLLHMQPAKVSSTEKGNMCASSSKHLNMIMETRRKSTGEIEPKSSLHRSLHENMSRTNYQLFSRYKLQDWPDYWSDGIDIGLTTIFGNLGFMQI